MRTGAFPERPGAAYVRTVLRGAAEVVVYPLIFGGGRLGIGPTGESFDGGMDRVWDYLKLDDAIAAAHEWDGNGEPAGYYRGRSGTAGSWTMGVGAAHA